jgi:cytoskeletal protein RodZ
MMEKAMANSRRRSLELDYERDERRPLLKVISRVAAVIGVTAIVGLVFFTLIPKFSRASDPPTLAASEVQTMDASVGAAKVASEESQAVLQKFVEFQKSQESNKPDDDVSRSTLGGTAKVMPGKSQALLEKFMQWKQRQ